MVSTEVLSWIQEFGYFAVFLFGLAGSSFTPIPDPVLFLSLPFLTEQGELPLLLSFFCCYLGFMGSLYGKYLAGRYFGSSVLAYLEKRKKHQKHIASSRQMVAKYGGISIPVSFFIPIVRHLHPLLLGVSSYSHSRYLLISFGFGFLWSGALTWISTWLS